MTLNSLLEQGNYNVVLRVYDNNDMHQDNSIKATVCDCKGDEFQCQKMMAGTPLYLSLGILAAILALLRMQFNYFIHALKVNKGAISYTFVILKQSVLNNLFLLQNL